MCLFKILCCNFSQYYRRAVPLCAPACVLSLCCGFATFLYCTCFGFCVFLQHFSLCHIVMLAFPLKVKWQVLVLATKVGKGEVDTVASFWQYCYWDTWSLEYIILSQLQIFVCALVTAKSWPILTMAMMCFQHVLSPVPWQNVAKTLDFVSLVYTFCFYDFWYCKL